ADRPGGRVPAVTGRSRGGAPGRRDRGAGALDAAPDRELRGGGAGGGGGVGRGDGSLREDGARQVQRDAALGWDEHGDRERAEGGAAAPPGPRLRTASPPAVRAGVISIACTARFRW